MISTKEFAKGMFDGIGVQIRSEIDKSQRVAALEQRIAALEQRPAEHINVTATDDDIVITPAMIRAGLHAFAGFNENFENRADRLAEVYRAMAECAQDERQQRHRAVEGQDT